MTEAAVRRKDDSENRNSRTATRTVRNRISGAAISLSISLIGSTPFYAPFKYIDLIDGQGNALKTFELGETAESQFSVTGTEVTLPTGANLKAGDRFVVKYKYESEEGVAINDSADKFSTEGEFVIEAFCYNPCDKANKKLMRIIFPNAKMDNAIDMTLNNELTHPVKISATQEYCSDDKRLFRIETAAA